MAVVVADQHLRQRTDGFVLMHDAKPVAGYWRPRREQHTSQRGGGATRSAEAEADLLGGRSPGVARHIGRCRTAVATFARALAKVAGSLELGSELRKKSSRSRSQSDHGRHGDGPHGVVLCANEHAIIGRGTRHLARPAFSEPMWSCPRPWRRRSRRRGRRARPRRREGSGRRSRANDCARTLAHHSHQPNPRRQRIGTAQHSGSPATVEHLKRESPIGAKQVDPILRDALRQPDRPGIERERDATRRRGRVTSGEWRKRVERHVDPRVGGRVSPRRTAREIPRATPGPRVEPRRRRRGRRGKARPLRAVDLEVAGNRSPGQDEMKGAPEEKHEHARESELHPAADASSHALATAPAGWLKQIAP